MPDLNQVNLSSQPLPLYEEFLGRREYKNKANIRNASMILLDSVSQSHQIIYLLFFVLFFFALNYVPFSPHDVGFHADQIYCPFHLKQAVFGATPPPRSVSQPVFVHVIRQTIQPTLIRYKFIGDIRFIQ